MAWWAVMTPRPADIGYSDEGDDMPPLNYHMHAVKAGDDWDGETMFPMQAQTLQERIAARRNTVTERVDMGFNLVIGSFLDKLAKCHGSQNMPSANAQNINPTPKSGKDGKAKGETLSKTQNTCENTISETEISLEERQSSKQNSISSGEIDMHLIPSTGKSASATPKQGPQAPDDHQCSNPNTGWTPMDTTRSSQSKMGDAQSAETSQSDISTLTIAMRAAKSEGFFAAHAIPASVISEMTRNGLIEPWCIWCNLNSEQDALAKAFGPLAFSVQGSTADDKKERDILAWMDGERPIMISKPSIIGFGMNFQHCRNTAFIGLNDSWEQFYQAVRRFWRFGQTRPVDCHIVTSELEGATVANIKRKEADADRMAASMVLHMADLSSLAIRGSVRDTPNYNPQDVVRLPDFLGVDRAA